jgi:hypothetical protein
MSVEGDDPIKQSTRYLRHDDAVAEQSGDRVIVLHASGGRLSTLSPVGSIVWDALPANRGAIQAALVDRFDEIDPDVIAADLERFLGEMTDLGVIVCVDADD